MVKILIVDDDADSRRLLCEALAPLDAHLHCCSDGIYALDALRCNDDFDLLVTDIAMPVLDGRQLLSYITRDRNLPRVPVLITSGFIDQPEVDRLLEAGAAGYLAKPYDLENVLETCARHLPATEPVAG